LGIEVIMSRSSKSAHNSYRNGITTAFRTLTIISVPGQDDRDLSKSIPWFPIIGLVLGLILYGIARMWMLLPFSQWSACAALLILVAEIYLTRGMHLDGLADWADSIGGFLQRERRLAIMKDPGLGTFGVLALIIAFLAKWLAIERLLVSGTIFWLLVILGLSRNMMAELITTLPYAREEGGIAQAFVNGASHQQRLASHIIALILCLSFGPLALAFFVLAGVITWFFRRVCLNQFGGITGDLLGAANEIIEVCLLIICALPGKSILHYWGWAWVF
jgi:adenosylcobinamide-GDP ribazoletransferase